MLNRDWNNFYRLTKDQPPHGRLLEAVERLGRTGEALDLGCGTRSDTGFLVAQGFHVTAVDREAAALESLADLPHEKIERVQSSFEDFSFARYDLINAHYALPFIKPDLFGAVFTRLKGALRPGGIFVGQFFGVQDSWNTAENQMTFFTCEEALNQLAPLEVLEFEEEAQEGLTAEGVPKYWHIFHILARKLLT
jgi:SAM-dependent methyltransferase